MFSPFGLFIAALIVLGVVGGIYLFRHPEILGKAQRTIEAANQEAKAPVQTKAVGYRAGPISFTRRMENLPPNTLLTVRDPETTNPVQLQVKTTEKVYGLKQYSGPDWRRSGEAWRAVLCVADPSWSRTDVLLLQLDTAAYLFKKRTRLPAEGAQQFVPYAKSFAHDHDQKAGSVSMPWHSKQYAIQDIGKWEVEASDDDPHIPDGQSARWIVAHADDGTAIIVEDAEGNADSVWEGWVVDLDRVVTDVLTSDGH